MARADAAPLIALSHRISHEGSCAQARDIPLLEHRTETLVNARRVPAALAESLMSGVNALSAEAPVCLPSVPATTAVVPAPAPESRHVPHGHRKEHGHGHGKHGGEGD